MPPVPTCSARRVTAAAAERLGYHPYRAPTGVNSVEYDGRPACNNCGFCAFYGCPIEAKGDPVGLLRAGSAHRTLRDPTRGERHRDRARRHRHAARGVRYLDAARRRPRGHRRARRRGLRRVRDASPAPALRRRATPTSSAATSCTTSRRSCSGCSRSGSTRTVAGRSPTSWTTRSSPTIAALAAAREAGLPYFRGGIVEHGGAGQPIMEAIHLPAGELHSRLMLDSPMRDCMAAFTMQGEDLPQAIQPHRPRPPRPRRVGTSRGSGHLQPPPPRGRVRARTGHRDSRRS